MQTHSPLERLASVVGILPQYIDQTGTETRFTSDRTRVAILRAMGIEAESAEQAHEELEKLENREWQQVLAPVRVVRIDADDVDLLTFRVKEGSGGPAEWWVEVIPESGEPIHRGGVAQPEWDGSFAIRLGAGIAEGYHTVRVTSRRDGEERSGEQSLIVVPARCPSVQEVTGRDRVFGLTANLYTVRSETNWGVGEITDLARLLRWTANAGGSFVGVNPLHALRNQGMDVSPYSPVSRIYRNPIYLDIAAVPELRHAPEARDMVASPPFREEIGSLRASGRVEYERISRLKRQVLEVLHRQFRSTSERAGGGRGADYREFLEREGEPLELFATFEALVDQHGAGDWRQWPEEFRDPRGDAVARFQLENEEAIGFHTWIQFELDRQLAEAARAAADAGMSIGLYQDLAIGASPSGADVWANPGLFLTGIDIGAPPDDYSATGQNWGLPPLDPHRLREDRYRYWIQLVRASFRNGGALRIDHVLGLFRQFWIPHGLEGADGAYVRFPADDLLGILALEARRHGAVVVGEDLGTVPPEVPPTLHQRGILSSRVFYFERQGDSFRPASEYEPRSLATANTHDMPTLAGFWNGRDIEVKREVGMIDSDEETADQLRSREGERQAVLRRLAEDGVLEGSAEADGAQLRGAIHGFLCRSPAEMVGLNLDDLVGEVEPVNLPGVSPERFSAWTRKLSLSLEELELDPDVRIALRCDGR
jgi:4-alpha-glucanotransferase